MDHLLDALDGSLFTKYLADRLFQDLITPAAHSGNGRTHHDVRHNTDPLSRPLVRIENTDPADHGLQASRQREWRNISIRTSGRAANDDCLWRSAECHGRVFGLADRYFVHQHHYFARIVRLPRFQQFRLRPMERSRICQVSVREACKFSLALHQMRTERIRNEFRWIVAYVNDQSLAVCCGLKIVSNVGDFDGGE